MLSIFICSVAMILKKFEDFYLAGYGGAGLFSEVYSDENLYTIKSPSEAESYTTRNATRNKTTPANRGLKEAPTRFELVIMDLQSTALPLGYGASLRALSACVLGTYVRCMRILSEVLSSLAILLH